MTYFRYHSLVYKGKNTMHKRGRPKCFYCFAVPETWKMILCRPFSHFFKNILSQLFTALVVSTEQLHIRPQNIHNNNTPSLQWIHVDLTSHRYPTLAERQTSDIISNKITVSKYLFLKQCWFNVKTLNQGWFNVDPTLHAKTGFNENMRPFFRN